VKLILASNNEKKLKELREILTQMGHEVQTQQEAGCHFEVAETGGTFLENARLKAAAVVRATGCAAIADDSGLAVEILGGAPGVDSAYYGGESCKTDEERTRHLLQNMKGQINRRARFVSCIVCLFPNGRSIEAEGSVTGEILTEPQGEGGFGYDPVFYIPEKGQTFAQMSAETKHSLSHRGRALKKFKEKWEEIYVNK